jgi:hypothetical protein
VPTHMVDLASARYPGRAHQLEHRELGRCRRCIDRGRQLGLHRQHGAPEHTHRGVAMLPLTIIVCRETFGTGSQVLPCRSRRSPYSILVRTLVCLLTLRGLQALYSQTKYNDMTKKKSYEVGSLL